MFREFVIVKEGLGGTHDVVFGLRVGILPLDEATRLASADELTFGSFCRGTITLILVFRNKEK
jgi:hypothetical protein